MSDFISQLELEYANSPSPELLKELMLQKNKFDTLSSTDAEKMLLRSHNTYYEFGDKASRILAH